MNPAKKSDLFPFLESHGIGPKKAFSQNFLVDPNTVERIVNFAEVQQGDVVLEIGPGPGALTYALLEKGASVYAVEFDPAFCKALKSLNWNGLTLIEGDILKQDLTQILPKNVPFKVVSNLPYQITSPVMEYLSKNQTHLTSATLMIQKEVAERFAASPGESDYSHLTLFLNFYFEIKYGFVVPKKCFYPAPKIDSAIVKCKPVSPPAINPDLFFKVTRTAFNQKRKMLRASLTSLFSKEHILEALKQSGLKETARPQELSVSQFVDLVSQISNF